jgi:hypothetical protein
MATIKASRSGIRLRRFPIRIEDPVMATPASS